MKKLIPTIIILASSLLFNVTNAQVKACVWCAVNIAVQPNWGPTGYDYVDYYYIPDLESYYNVSKHQFIYHDHGAWKTSTSLPVRYATFNLYHAHKVVMNDVEPYLQHEANRAKYSSFKGQHDQHAIHDSHGPTYTGNKGVQHDSLKAARVTGNSQNGHKDKGLNQHKDDDKRKTLASR